VTSYKISVISSDEHQSKQEWSLYVELHRRRFILCGL